MNKKFFTTLAFYVTVAAIATIVLFPFLWMLASSFKTQVDIIAWHTGNATNRVGAA